MTAAPIRLMVVEDDDAVRQVLRLSLEVDGYQVVEARGGEEALELLGGAEPDVMLVDLMLGGMSGFTCIREVRRSRDLPIIVVSARQDTHDVVAGLEAGADDYVTKPFQVKEITARIRALLRRAAPPTTAAERRPGAATAPAGIVLDAHGRERTLVLDRAGGRVLLGDAEVHLTLTEYRLLLELAESPGLVLSRAQLLEQVWGHDYFGDDRLVDVHIRRLRTKVETDPSDPRLLVTVRGLGYRFDPG